VTAKPLKASAPGQPPQSVIAAFRRTDRG